MTNIFKGMVVGALAFAGATLATAEAEAMPVQPLTQTAVSSGEITPVYYYRYGYRRPFVRGYGFRRPFYGYRRFRPYGYGYRRPFYGYRRPFYGYGYRRYW